MKKKKVLSLLLVAVMAFSLTACGSGNDDKEAKKDGAAGDDNTLTVWAWDPNFNIYAMNKATEIYEKEHEGFKIEISELQQDDIETRITTAVTANDLSTLPDIFLMQDNSYQKFVANYPDVFTELTDSGVDFSQFSEAKVANSTVDSKNYGVPFDNGAVINCLRTDYLEAAGFTVEDFEDITWSDYMEKAKIVLEKTGEPMLTGVAGSPDQVILMLQSCDSSMFNEDGSVNFKDNEALKKVFEIYTQMIKDGTFVETTDWDQYIGSINNGTVASAMNGCWVTGSITAAEDQTNKWAVTNIPKVDGIEGATNYSNNGGCSWAISSNCKNVDLAIDFLNSTFAGSTELYDDIIQKGALATWAPAGESEAYNQPVEFFGNDKVFSKIVDYATKTPAINTGAYYYDARDALGVAVSRVVQEGKSVDEALTEAQETVEFNMGQ